MTAPATTSAATLAALLRPPLLRLTRVIRQQRVDLSVTLTQLSALHTLRVNGPMSAGELATCERVQPPSMTKVIAMLEEHGLACREPHPADKRQAIITITPAGVELLEDETRSRDAWLTQQLAGLEPDEVALLRRVVPILDKLAGQ